MKTTTTFKINYNALITIREGLFEAYKFYFIHDNEVKADEMKTRYDALTGYFCNLEKALVLATKGTMDIEL